MNDNFLDFLGLVKKSGKLKTGFDEVLNSVKINKSKMVLFAKDYSVKNFKKISSICEEKNIKTFVLDYKMNQLEIITKKLTGVMTINDPNFCKKIHQLIEENNKYR